MNTGSDLSPATRYNGLAADRTIVSNGIMLEFAVNDTGMGG